MHDRDGGDRGHERRAPGGGHDALPRGEQAEHLEGTEALLRGFYG
ncbi:hypothetical protein [Agromyces sp. C10]|nr:hypothetical protein [Agromyces sp. C10]